MVSVRGMTFIDVIVGTGIMLVVFLSIFSAYKLAIDLVLNTKARIGGMSLVSQQLEYVRGLPYDTIGTVGGIPSGTILQSATTSLNNITYTLETLVKYVDDPADGLDNADTNGITADYKEIKVDTLWTLHGKTFTTFAVTRVAPHGIESLANGGTLRVNVFDAAAAPVQGASVHVTNASTSPTINLTVDTDAQGSIAFPGAPAASNYKISVTKTDYSSAQTYDVTGANPNPNPGHVSVANKKTTTASFAIDKTGTLNVLTYSPLATGFFDDPFSNQTKLTSTTSTTVAGGVLQLLDAGLGYPLTGDAVSIAVAPSELASWDLLTWSATTTAGTTLGVQVLYLSAGTYLPIPDGILAGNSAGLTSGSVVLSGVSTSTYSSLKLRAFLGTDNASTTPTLTQWHIDYHAGPSPLPNIGFTIHGAKTIGTAAGGAPLYKVSQINTTASNGAWLITPLEWDSYTIGMNAFTYDIAEQCPSALSVSPAQAQTVSLLLQSHTTNSLRVAATGTGGVPLAGATVAIAGSTNATSTASSCGQTFFSGLGAGNYTLSITKSGYQPSTQTVAVSGASVVSVPLSP